jgi:flagellar motor switch protein FliM
VANVRFLGGALSEILSQAEIEALLSSLSSEGGEAAAPVAAAAEEGPSPQVSRRVAARSAIAYDVYDFRRPDKFSKDQLRTLQMLHETFGRLSSSSLSGYLRTPVNIDLISLEQVPYEEYLRSINQSVFTIMSLPPLNGQAVLEIEFAIVFSMIDKLLGGPGRAIDRQNLTEIELPLVRQMIERMFVGLKSAWEGVVIVNPGIEGMETSAQFVQIAPPTDIVISVLFEIRVGDVRGAMSLCIPYMVLKPITTKLSAQKWFASGNRRQNAASRRSLVRQLEMTSVECAVELGRARLHVKDFLRLRSGDLLRLDQKVEDDIRMLVQQTPKYEGKAALNGKKIAFNVTGPFPES